MKLPSFGASLRLLRRIPFLSLGFVRIQCGFFVYELCSSIELRFISFIEEYLFCFFHFYGMLV